MRFRRIVSVVGLIALAWAATAQAHHSGAMFDSKKRIVVSGTVKQWNFVNPHSWLIIEGRGPDGKSQTWSFEGASPAAGGDSPTSTIRRDTFKPGDKVAVTTNPMKDGRPAGRMVEVKFADGHVWQSREGRRD
jgi:hypothetical protein